MKIVVNHLTRMHAGRICVAGVDSETHRHVRAIPLMGELQTDMLWTNGGAFCLSRVVDLGDVLNLAKRPHVEDHRFRREQVRTLAVLGPEAFWALLQDVAKPRLAELFGLSLKPHGQGSYIMKQGSGRASLGCLKPASPPELWIKRRPGRRDQVRMRLCNGKRELDLGVTDVRLYKSDGETVDTDAIVRLRPRLRSEETILSVGLTRPFSASPDMEPVHWLQVNNIHLRQCLMW